MIFSHGHISLYTENGGRVTVRQACGAISLIPLFARAVMRERPPPAWRKTIIKRCSATRNAKKGQLIATTRDQIIVAEALV